MPTILFAGGGSIGHIAPSVAVARELMKLNPDCTAHFVCSHRGEDESFLEAEGHEATAIRAPRLGLSFPWKFWKAQRRAGQLIDQLQPALVFCKGGYVSVPAAYAAKKRKIPIILHESDVSGGNANRLIARWAARICTGFPGTDTNKLQATSYTGNPIRTAITEGSRKKGLALTGFSGKRPIVLIIGGSQGALAINQAVAAVLPDLLHFCDVIHLTGRGKKTVTDSAEGYWQKEFVIDELPDLYAAADLAITRCGGSNLSELAGNAMPMILVPLRGVGRDHQQKNAEAVEAAGAGVVVQQEDLTTVLPEMIRVLTEDDDRHSEMAKASKKLHHPDAALQIAQIIADALDG